MNFEQEALSECCSAPSLYDIHDGLGTCSRCREHAVFIIECPACGKDLPVNEDKCPHCHKQKEYE